MLIRSPCQQAACSRAQQRRREPIRCSHATRSSHSVGLRGHCLPSLARQQLTHPGRQKLAAGLHATPKEEAEIEAMKSQMAGSDIWESELVSILFKIVVAAGIIGVTFLLATAAQPVIDSTINAFPRA